MKRIITILLILALFTPCNAEHNIVLDADKTGFTISILDMEVYAMDIDASDPWNTYVSPGETINIMYTICNWGPVTEQYYGDFILIDSVGMGDSIWSSPVTTVGSNDCIDYEFSMTAPNTPGTYTLKAITSFYPSGIEDDVDYWTLHVEGTPTPTSTPLATATQTPNQPPIIDVELTKSGYIYNYDASGSKDIDGSIVSYTWTVDNTLAGSQQTFTLDTSKFTAGIHTVKLVIEDNFGLSSSYVQTISVTANEEGSTTIQESEAMTEEGNILETDQGIAKFVVNVGGEPYYLPGFESIFAIAGLIIVAALIKRE